MRQTRSQFVANWSQFSRRYVTFSTPEIHIADTFSSPPQVILRFMLYRRLAHLSDLHLSGSPGRAEAIVKKLWRDDIEHVVVTGDITHEGAHAEYGLFRDVFAPLLRQGRVSFVPGNHDRTGEDVGSTFMNGQRVRTEQHDGLFLVCVDSTGPHNRSYFASHGDLCHSVLRQVDEAVSRAPHHSFVVVLLHHHLVPLPEESMPEWLATRLGFPHASELELGMNLLGRLLGRCDLILHGHRHVPREFEFGTTVHRRLGMYNAGSSTELGAYRIFEHKDGRGRGAPTWYAVDGLEPKHSISRNVLPAIQHAVRQLRAPFARSASIR